MSHTEQYSGSENVKVDSINDICISNSWLGPHPHRRQNSISFVKKNSTYFKNDEWLDGDLCFQV